MNDIDFNKCPVCGECNTDEFGFKRAPLDCCSIACWAEAQEAMAEADDIARVQELIEEDRNYGERAYYDYDRV